MLFTKNKKTEILEGIIKEELSDGQGNLLLKLNLKYPDIKCRKNDPLAVFAAPFYKKLALGLAEHARGELFKSASEAFSLDPASFLPYSAVMRYDIVNEDSNILSVALDISISDGQGRIRRERKTQVWEREFGTKCKISYFMPEKELKSKLLEKYPELDIKHIDRELFSYKNGDIVFYSRENERENEYSVAIIEKNSIKEHE